MRDHYRFLIFCFSAFLIFCFLPACTPASKTTRIRVADYQAMAVEMAESLRHSRAIAERGPDSPPWRVSIQKVTNLTSDVMSEGEQWSIVEQIRSSLPITEMLDEKNITLLLSAEGRRAAEQTLKQQGFAPETDASAGTATSAGQTSGGGDLPGVTHVMTATFRSLTRAEKDARTELYACVFEMIELETGRPVWVDQFEYKRSAQGLIWD